MPCCHPYGVRAPPGARLPSMHHQRGIRSVRCARSCTASSRQHAPAASLWSSPTRGTSQRCRSNDEIAVTQSRHSVPPTECRDYLAERCRGALERGGVPQRRGRTLVAMRRKSEPSVTLLMHIEMQPRTSLPTRFASSLFITDPFVLPPCLRRHAVFPLFPCFFLIGSSLRCNFSRVFSAPPLGAPRSTLHHHRQGSLNVK